MLDDDRHIKFMRLALELAQRARGHTAPNPMVGCVIVKDHEIIGSGYHQCAGQNHAEINAILSLTQADTREATCYVTLEPCCHQGRTGPCVLQLIQQQFKTVVVAMVDPNPLVAGKGIAALKDAGINVIVGICEQEAIALNKGFITRITKNRPYVRSKIAASLDGCIALENGQSKWITNEAARLDVHRMRAHSDAIVTTAATVMADDPSMNVRLADANIKQPLRVVIDKNLETSPNAKIYDQNIAKTIIITSHTSINNLENTDKINSFNKLGVQLHILPIEPVSNRFNILELWYFLTDLGCNDVMVEAGSGFNSCLLINNHVDEWHVYQSGLIMGNSARKMFSLQAEDSMSKLFKLKCNHVRQLDDNWLLILSQE